MAIEIIGKDESIFRIATCKGCGTICRYEKRDVTSKSVRHFDETETLYSIECPECKENIKTKGWW
jgi:hypothetical protein